MKHVLPCSIAVLVIFATSLAQAQTPKTPEDVVREFYQLYLRSLNQEEEPLVKHRAEFSKLVTQRLLRSYDRASRRENGINADFFLDAQDWDQDWEKNISVSKAIVQGTRATVSVKLKGGSAGDDGKTWDNNLKVGLVKEGRLWKIDSVNKHLNVT